MVLQRVRYDWATEHEHTYKQEVLKVEIIILCGSGSDGEEYDTRQCVAMTPNVDVGI